MMRRVRDSFLFVPFKPCLSIVVVVVIIIIGVLVVVVAGFML